MIILDTCALIFDSLTPDKLSSAAKKAIINAEKKNGLYCCDISLWEIAMLIQKKRLDVGDSIQNFLKIMLQARSLRILKITVEIAELSVTHAGFKHFDPADRIIAASAIQHNASLVTCDKQLSHLADLNIVW